VIVIDTSLFVDAQRGRQAARQRLDDLLRRPEDLAVSAMTVLEIFAVPGLPPRWSRFYERVFAAVEILDLDAPSAEAGARLSRDMARRGLRLHNSDAAIAGSAARAGAALLVTSDADFTELRGLRVEYVQPS
jgi:predicted nucleic acid-binding protein